MGQYKKGTSLAFDTDVLRNSAKKLVEEAEQMRKSALELDRLLTELSETGWTTKSGKLFQEMAENKWENNVKQYADLLDMLSDCLESASDQYDSLQMNTIDILHY